MTPVLVRYRRWRERRFVRNVVRYLGDKDRLYIHPVEGGGATILIAPYDPLPKYNHAHIEGDMQRPISADMES